MRVTLININSHTEDPYMNYNSAFLHFSPEDDLENAASVLDGMIGNGYKCKVEIAKPCSRSSL